MIFHMYSCFNCKNDIVIGYPKEDDEPQFCCKECRDEYIKKHGRLPRGVLQNC